MKTQLRKSERRESPGADDVELLENVERFYAARASVLKGWDAFFRAKVAAKLPELAVNVFYLRPLEDKAVRPAAANQVAKLRELAEAAERIEAGLFAFILDTPATTLPGFLAKLNISNHYGAARRDTADSESYSKKWNDMAISALRDAARLDRGARP